MRKIISTVIILCLFITTTTAMSAATYKADDMAAYGQETVKVYKTTATPKIDGVVSPGEYNQAIRILKTGDKAVYFNGDIAKIGAEELKNTLPTEFILYAAYDNDYLYIAVTNNDLNHCVPLTGTGVWDGDYLEFDIGTNLTSDWDSITDKLRLAMGLSSANNEECIYAAAVQSDAKEKWPISQHIPNVGKIVRDEANKLTTYEAMIPWENITPDGKVPSRAFFYYQLGIADESLISKSDYSAYLGVYRYAILQSDAMKADTGASIIPHIMLFAGDAPEIETKPSSTAAASTTAAQTFDKGLSMVFAIAAIAFAGIVITKKRKIK